MKTSPLWILLIASICQAAETSRMWTSPDGKMVDATLTAKTDTTATLMITKTRKSVTFALDKLSVSDRGYVKNADVRPPAEMTARTESVKSNTVDRKTDGGTKQRKDERSVSVEMSKVEGRDIEIEVLFLGDDGGSRVGVFKTLKKTVNADGKTSFDVLYPATLSGVAYDDNYRGWVVRASYKGGEEIARQASQKPFERFLDGE